MIHCPRPSPRHTSLPVLLQNRPSSSPLPPNTLPLPPAKTIPSIPIPHCTWPLSLSFQITQRQTTTTSVLFASNPSALASDSQVRNLTLFQSAVMPFTRWVSPPSLASHFIQSFLRHVLLPSMAPLQISKVEPPPENPISACAVFAGDP